MLGSGSNMDKAHDAFRTISEVATELGVPKHVLRFWESKFPQIKPMKRGGGRRYYRPEDLELLGGIQHLLHGDGYTIKGVQKILREQGVEAVKRGPDRVKQSSKRRGAGPKGSPATAKAGPKRPLPLKDRQTQDSTDGAFARVEHARATKREMRAQLDDLIKELEACRALLVGPRKSRAQKSTVKQKTAKARTG